jgi:hypothetical protein
MRSTRRRRLVRKALATSLVVGTILTIINQGDALLGGRAQQASSDAADGSSLRPSPLEPTRESVSPVIASRRET